MVSIRGIVRRTRKLWEPAPMRDFSDYDDYWHQRGEIRIVFGRWRLTADALPDSGTLIDVGCGTGEFLTYLRDHRHSGLTMKGVDGSAESVRMTQQRGFDATVVNLLSGALPEKAEYLTCFEVLEHIPDAEVALRAMRDACQKRIFISVPNIGYIGCRARLALFGRFPLTTCVMHIKEHVRFWTVRDFRQWAESNGLRLVRARGTRGLGPLYRLSASLFSATVLYELEPMPQSA